MMFQTRDECADDVGQAVKEEPVEDSLVLRQNQRPESSFEDDEELQKALQIAVGEDETGTGDLDAKDDPYNPYILVAPDAVEMADVDTAIRSTINMNTRLIPH